MSTAVRSITLFVSVSVVLAAFSFAGCDSGRERNATTAKATATVPVDATKAKQELDHVVGALRGIRDASDTADLKRLYGELKDHTAQFTQTLTAVMTSSDSAVAAGKAQIEKWHEQANTFTDADLRNSSNKREAELRQAVDDLSASTASLKTTGETYQAKLSQTLNALDLDLTQPGVQSIKPVIVKLIDEEAQMRAALTEVSAKSTSVNSLITP